VDGTCSPGRSHARSSLCIERSPHPPAPSLALSLSLGFAALWPPTVRAPARRVHPPTHGSSPIFPTPVQLVSTPSHHCARTPRDPPTQVGGCRASQRCTHGLTAPTTSERGTVGRGAVLTGGRVCAATVSANHLSCHARRRDTPHTQRGQRGVRDIHPDGASPCLRRGPPR
jgi:hypothetical protein